MDELPPHDNDAHAPEPPPQAAPMGDWLEDAERRVLDAAIDIAPETGWNDRLAAAALRQAGLNSRERRLVIPGGARDLAALLSRRHDDRALEALGGVDGAAMKIRERITAAVRARIEAAMADEAAVRRANGFLALPFNAPLAMRLAWESADRLWRWAGDTATDENHYSKRAILSAVLLSTLAARLRGGEGHAREHLDHRIAQVMDFEKLKARLPRLGERGEDLASWLGKLRYGAQEKMRAHYEAHGLTPPPRLAPPKPEGAPRHRGAEHFNPPPDPFG